MNPYEVLGVSSNASDEEIKSKYRTLSRKYHPDANVGKPNQKELEEKFKEVQQAYNAIMDERQGKTVYNNSYGFNGYNNSDSYESQDDQYMNSALNYIRNGYYREGLNVLNNVKNRQASWYYYSAFSNYQVGNNAIALEHITTACNMEPGNPYYIGLLNEISSGGSRYQQRSNSYGGNPVSGNFNTRIIKYICAGLLCADCICGGGLGYGLPIICCL